MSSCHDCVGVQKVLLHQGHESAVASHSTLPLTPFEAALDTRLRVLVHRAPFINDTLPSVHLCILYDPRHRSPRTHRARILYHAPQPRAARELPPLAIMPNAICDRVRTHTSPLPPPLADLADPGLTATNPTSIISCALAAVNLRLGCTQHMRAAVMPRSRTSSLSPIPARWTQLCA